MPKFCARIERADGKRPVTVQVPFDAREHAITYGRALLSSHIAKAFVLTCDGVELPDTREVWSAASTQALNSPPGGPMYKVRLYLTDSDQQPDSGISFLTKESARLFGDHLKDASVISDFAISQK